MILCSEKCISVKAREFRNCFLAFMLQSILQDNEDVINRRKETLENFFFIKEYEIEFNEIFV